jgi:hypothetical protein
MKRALSLGAIGLLLVTSASGVAALDLEDGSKLPASYGREIETKDKDGKPVKTVAFNGMAQTIPPAELHAVLTAYGLQVVDGSKLPASYGREIETKDKDGKPVKTVAFNGMAATIPPAELHAVLSAYGAKLVDGSKLPASYGREIETKDKDGKPVKTVAFNGMAATIPPAELHAVLAAYGR